jgi:hypothetical protein
MHRRGRARNWIASDGRRHPSDLQSLIAIQLGVTGALPFQIRLTLQRGTRRESEHVPDVYLRLAFAVVIGATIKSLAARSSRREHADRCDDGPARLVSTPAPGVVTAAIRGKDP